MIKITINGKNYKGVYRWEDMTLRQFCDLAAIPFPEGYEAYLRADGNFTADTFEEYAGELLKLTDKQVNEDFPEYYRKVFACLTNIPADLISKLDPEKLSQDYESYFKPFVMSLISHNPLMHFMGNIIPYTPKEVKWFGLGWGFYKVPETVTYMGERITLKNEPVITFIEASDLFRGLRVTKDLVNRLAMFMAFYCRKWGEKYSEEKSLARQELFMNVRMSLVWSVFFYTVRRMPASERAIQLFGGLPRPIREAVQEVRTYKSMVTTD